MCCCVHNGKLLFGECFFVFVKRNKMLITYETNEFLTQKA